MSAHDDKIHIAVDDGRIAGTLVTPEARIPGVLFVHGWGGSQNQYLVRAREIAVLGCVCLTFDLRGHGSTLPQYETVSRESNLRDVLAAYDVLASHRMVDASEIAVVGSSYGGYLAAILTTLRPVKWLALRVPALYMDSGWELPKRQLHKDQDLGTYRRSLVRTGDNRALRACADFTGDVLVVESEFDHVIPHAVIASYLSACTQVNSLTYRIIKGADHGLTAEGSQRSYITLLTNWLTEMVLGERDGNTPAPSTLPGAPTGPA